MAEQTKKEGVAQKAASTTVKNMRKKVPSSSTENQEMLRCKRRITFQNLGYSLPQANPASVHRRNERERNRVKLVNLGFANLREHVPNGAKNKKMSKVDTLKSAIEYINELQRLLEEYQSYDAAYSSAQRRMPLYSSDTTYMPVSTPSTDYSDTSPAYTDVSPNEYCNGSPTNYSTASSSSSSYPPDYHYQFQHQNQNQASMYCPAGGGYGAAMSTGSPTPSYLSDNSTGDAPVSPKDSMFEVTSWVY